MSYKRNYSIEKSLSKDSYYKKVSGVCAGIAKHFQLPRFLIRLVTIISLLMFPVATGVAYIVATLLLPKNKRSEY